MKLKVCVVLACVVVTSMLLPVGSAGAASGTVCKTERGTITFSPTLPKEGSGKTVNSTAYWKGTFAGCNNGVTGGDYTGTEKLGDVNCITTIGKKGTATEKITWKPASAGTSTIRFSGAPSATGGTYAGVVTSGRFKGTSVSLHEVWAKLLPSGGCGTTGLKAINLKQATSAHI